MAHCNFTENPVVQDATKSHMNWSTRKALWQEGKITLETILLVSHVLFSVQIFFVYFLTEDQHEVHILTVSFDILSLILTLVLIMFRRKRRDSDASDEKQLQMRSLTLIKLIDLALLGAAYIMTPLLFTGLEKGKGSPLKYTLIDDILTILYGISSYLVSQGMKVRTWFVQAFCFFLIHICFAFIPFDFSENRGLVVFTVVTATLLGPIMYFLAYRISKEHEVFLRSERILKDIIFNLPSGLLLLDESSNPIFTNGKMMEILGLPGGSDLHLLTPILNSMSFEVYKKESDAKLKSWPPSSSDSWRKKVNHFSLEQPLKFADILKAKRRFSTQRYYYYTTIEWTKRNFADNRRENYERNYQGANSFASNEKFLTNAFGEHKLDDPLGAGDNSHYKIEVSHFTDEAPFILVTFIDITAAKSITESNLEKTFKNSLLNSFSHELKTPLNNTLMVLGCGIQDPWISHDIKENYLIHPYNSLCLLNMVISEIIDFLKLDSDGVQLTSEVFSLKNLLKEVNQLTQIRAKDRGIELRVQENGILPSLALRTDRERLLRMLTNLVLNCIKYTFKGHVQVKVAPPRMNSNFGREGFVTLEISDTRYLQKTEVADKDEDMNLTIMDYDEFGALPDEKNELTLIINKAMVKYLLPEENSFLCQISRGGISYKLKIPCEKGLAKIPSELSERKESYEDTPTKLLQSIKSIHERGRSIDEVSMTLNNEALYIKSRFNSGLSINQERPDKRLELRPCSSFNLSDTSCQIPSELDPINPQKGVVWGGTPKGTLPQADPVKEKPLEQGTSPEIEIRIPESKITALLVDDESFNLLSLEMILKSEGVECIKALNGKLALDIISELNGAQKLQIDIALLDLRMPVMDGFECASCLVSMIKSGLLPKFPIIACSANDSVEDREKATASGFNAFIAKPLSMRKLRDALSGIGWEKNFFTKHR